MKIGEEFPRTISGNFYHFDLFGGSTATSPVTSHERAGFHPTEDVHAIYYCKRLLALKKTVRQHYAARAGKGINEDADSLHE
jgi:hypothetical protein